jgi:16S rRNA U1498 N3-methylase RsmE
MIDEINVEIEELMRVLERKKKEKDMLILEKQVHEHKIEMARLKYKDKLSIIDEQSSKVKAHLIKNDKEN